MDFLFREPLLQAVVGHADGSGFLAYVAVGLARVGVLLLDNRRDVKPVGGFQRGSAGKASDADHGIGLELLKDATCFGQTADEFERQAKY